MSTFVLGGFLAVNLVVRIQETTRTVKIMAKKVTKITTEFIIRWWDIEGFPNYFFGKDKKLYRYDSRGRVKSNKRIVIGTTQGYILKSKFYSLAQLRPLLRLHAPQPGLTNYPTGF